MVKLKTTSVKSSKLVKPKTKTILKAKNRKSSLKKVLDTNWDVEVLSTHKVDLEKLSRKDLRYKLLKGTTENRTEQALASEDASEGVAVAANGGKSSEDAGNEETVAANGGKSNKKSFDVQKATIESDSHQMQMPISEYQNEHALIEEKFKVKQDCVKQAAVAVLQLIKEQRQNRNELFDDDPHPVQLQICAMKVPKCPGRKLRIPLRHPLITESSEVCLIAGDDLKAGRKKHSLVIERWEELFKTRGVTCIKRILPYHELQTVYSQYEMKLKLADLYDAFFIESKIHRRVISNIGHVLYKKHKPTTFVKLEHVDPKKEIDKAIKITQMGLNPRGDCFNVQVGNTKLLPNQIVDNVFNVIEVLSKEFPGCWDNIRSLHLKGATTAPCPIYMTLKNKSDVPVPVIKTKRPKAFAPVEGELTTRYNAAVTVYPTGEVVVKKMNEQGLISTPEDDIEDAEISEAEDEIGDGEVCEGENNEDVFDDEINFDQKDSSENEDVLENDATKEDDLSDTNKHENKVAAQKEKNKKKETFKGIIKQNLNKNVHKVNKKKQTIENNQQKLNDSFGKRKLNSDDENANKKTKTQVNKVDKKNFNKQKNNRRQNNKQQARYFKNKGV